MGTLGETLRKVCDMEKDMDRDQKKEEMDPIMIDEDRIKEIMDREGYTCSGRPYQYNINTKKREVTKWEGLESDEEEVEYIFSME
jgi:hypothetical protein